MRLKNPKGESKGRVLAITEGGSIFETFFREDVFGKPVPVLLHIAD
jgi:hypothetical protein